MKKISRILTFVLALTLFVSSFAGGFTLTTSAEETSTRVYFYNTDDWAKVNAYVFNASNGEALGGWPGKAATNEGDGWWHVDVPAAPQFMIIFNNGSGSQTKDVPISDASSVYVTVTGKTFASKEAAEATIGPGPASTTVWFYNSDNWASVNAYVFGATNGEALGTWPGKAAVNAGDGWWSVEVPAYPEFKIIFNNGSGAQTGNISIADEHNVYVTVNNAVFGSKEAAEASLSGEPAATTVWFYNSDGWEAVSAYVFGTSNGKDLGTWPGTAATRDGETDWWYVEVPADPAFTIIFSGSGGQTGDIAIADENNVYVTVNNAVFGSKAAAEASFGSGTEPEPAATTVWFYNSNGWDAVNAYVFGASNGEALGTWPGTAATRDGETDWWYVEVPADPAFSIIFNGSGGQTGDIAIADKTSVYLTVNNEVFASKKDAEDSIAGAEPVSTRVWFYNSNGWDAVNAYVFGASNGEALGTWPGSAATRDGESDWWYVEVPANPTFSIIFNGSGFQTGDIAIADEANVYLTVNNEVFASKKDAEDSIASAEPVSTRVWFYNSNGWETVNAYVFGATNGEALGTWPGSAATRDGESDWWYAEVPANPTFSIIFNNGSGFQTGDIAIADKTNVYLTINNEVFASKKDAEDSIASAEPVSTKVWFYNSDNWETVNAYVFGAVNGEVLGTWPGSAATRDGESDWWYVEVPANPSFSIIFNNGSGIQTGDVLIADKAQVYVTVTGENAYPDKASAEAAQAEMDEDRKGTLRLWFYNSEGWAKVYAYIFGGSAGEALGTWPGTKATRDGERWWYIDIEADRPYTVIFNNGTNAQTKDIPINDSTNVYVTKDGTYATKEEAENSISTLKPIVSGYTTVWFYNNVGWENVRAYAWGTFNADPLGKWPGAQATRYEDTDWWYITCSFPPPFDIIFNDGIEGGAQTTGVRITNPWGIYTTPSSQRFSTREAAEAAAAAEAGDVKVYFYNTKGWSEVYAYTWGGARGESFGSWPGTPATRESEDSYWYYVELPVGSNIIFNNGVDEQTGDMTIEDKNLLYTTVNSEKFATREEAEATITEIKEIPREQTGKKQTIWYYNSENWNQVYIYAEDGEGEAILGEEPGVQMNKYGDTGWFYMDVICDPDFTVKFSDGGSAATGIFTVTEEAGVYFTAEGQFNSKDEAQETIAEPTEPSDQVQDVPAQEENESGLGGVIIGGGAVSVLAIGAVVLVLIKKRGKKSAV